MKYFIIYFLFTLNFTVLGQSHHGEGSIDRRSNSNAHEGHSSHGDEGQIETHSTHGDEGQIETHSTHGDEGKHEEHSTHKEEGNHEDHSNHEKEGKSDDHSDHGSAKAIGSGKSIVAVDEELGFMLSAKALVNLRVKLLKVRGPNFTVRDQAIVRSQKKIGVYRYKNGYFKFLSAKIISRNKVKNTFNIRVPQLLKNDQIAIGGVSLLRVVDVYSTDKSEYGHGH